MGNFNVIWNPKSWICFNQGMSSCVPGDIIYQMVIGEGEDHHHLHFQFVENISKENHENVVNDVYKLVTFPDADVKVLLFDDNNNLIPLVKGTVVHKELFNEEQNEYINSLVNAESRVLKKDNN